MTKEEIRLKAVDNAKKYEVWPPVADYQDGLIKGFEDGAEWMLDNPTGGALLYAVEKTVERTKREVIEKAVEWIRTNWREYINGPDKDGCIAFAHWENDFRRAIEEEV